MSKASVWHVYSTAMEAQSQTSVRRPMSDLCFTCQHNNTQIVRSANLPECAKSAVVRAQEEHLFRSSSERSFYRSTVKAVERTTHQVLTANNGIVPKNNPPCSLKGKMHYSYDYAQQVHYPSNPLQLGPIYFKTPQRCGVNWFILLCECADSRTGQYQLQMSAWCCTAVHEVSSITCRCPPSAPPPPPALLSHPL